MGEIPWTVAQIEQMFYAALRAGDAKGVDAALKVMTRLDPVRAGTLFDALSRAVKTEMAHRGLPTVQP